jgi:PTH1 family peptidyl-tRNA hydrolase
MLLVVGLGNPGREYEAHRHNVGFMVVDALARRIEAESFRPRFSAEIARGWLTEDTQALLLKPQTYMNLSGDSVQPCAAFHKVAVSDVLVVHDELDVPFGEVRLKRGGGHGGHNGLRSLIGRMGADFGRIRVGVGRPPASYRGEVADWLLHEFTAEERAELPKYVEMAVKGVLDIATRGFDAAMKTRNTRPKKQKPPRAERASANQEPPQATAKEATEGDPSRSAQ